MYTYADQGIGQEKLMSGHEGNDSFLCKFLNASLF